MNRSKRPVPPQGDNPDKWPELSELGAGSAQAGQVIPQQPPQMDQQQAAVPQPGDTGHYAAPAPAPALEQPGVQHPAQQQAQAPAPAPGQAYHMPQAPLAPAAGSAGPVTAPPEYTHPPQHTQPPAHTHPPQHQTQPPRHSEPAQFTAPPTSPPHEYTHPPQSHVPAAQAAEPMAPETPAPEPAATGDYTPQFNRYAPPPGMPLQAPQYGAEPAFGVPGEPGQLHAGQQPALQNEQSAAGHEQSDAGQDPRGYDLGQYNPVVPGVAAGMAAGSVAADPYQAEAYQQAAAGADYAAGQPVQGQQFQPEWTGGDASAGQIGDGADYSASGENEAFYDGYEEGDEGYDEPRRGGRGLLIASALVGAIALGGGLAYGYKHFVSGAKSPTGTRVIAADSRPVKVMPKNPGGRMFRNQDKKVFSSRLGSGSSRVASRTIANGNVRKVPTLVIKPNGSVAAPVARPAAAVAAAASPKQRLAVPGIYVPGVTVEPPRVGRSPQAASIRRVPAAATPAVVLPKARPLLKPAIQNSATIAATTRVIKPSKMVKKLAARAPVKKPVKKPAKLAAKIPVVAASTGGAGYVAWISSSKDRLRSLASFANLQQKFPAVLAGKQPEIQQKEVPNRGTWYRLRIGPPASKGATAALCKSLIAAKGVKQCFVRRY